MLKRNYFILIILLFGIIVASVLVGCDLFKKETILEGTWVGEEWIYVFDGSDFTIKYLNGTNRQKGPFSLNSTNTRFTQNSSHDWENGSWVKKTYTGVSSCDIVITGNTFTISNGWFTGSYTYTKQ